MDLIDKIGFIGALVMPLFNIPLIMRVIQRKSSEDISVAWAVGVWACIVLLAPAGFRSEDIVWRTFNYMNVIFFSVVMFVTLKYRKRKNESEK